MKYITIFHLKIIIFTSVKYYRILHGHVFVMHEKISFYSAEPRDVGTDFSIPTSHSCQIFIFYFQRS